MALLGRLLKHQKPNPVRSQALGLYMEGVFTLIKFSQPEGGDPKGWYDPHPLISRHHLLSRLRLGCGVADR